MADERDPTRKPEDQNDHRRSARPEPREPSRLNFNHPPPPSAYRGPKLTLGGITFSRTPTPLSSPPPLPSKLTDREKLQERIKEMADQRRTEEAQNREGLKREHQRQQQELKERLDTKFGPRKEKLVQEESSIEWQMTGRGALTRVFDRLTGREGKLAQSLAERREEIEGINADRQPAK